MRTLATGGLTAALVAALCTAGAATARAEEVVLASGVRYDASEVALSGGSVRFTFSVGGGRATMTLPLERLAPRSAFALLLARADPGDADAQLALGRRALELGLEAEATARFRRAADVDPDRAADRDAGLRAVAEAGWLERVARAEADLKRGRGDLALAGAKDVLAVADSAGTAARRAQALADIATGVAKRDADRHAAEAAAAAKAAAEATALAFDARLALALAARETGLTRRAEAADPAVSSSSAIRALDAASTALKESRRRLRDVVAVAGPRAAEVDAIDADVLAALLATWLDLADLHRQARAFDRARDHLRAVLVLAPDDARAQEIRARVEDDLARPPPVEPYDPAVPYFGFESTVLGTGYGYGPGYFGGSRGWRHRHVSPYTCGTSTVLRWGSGGLRITSSDDGFCGWRFRIR